MMADFNFCHHFLSDYFNFFFLFSAVAEIKAQAAADAKQTIDFAELAPVSGDFSEVCGMLFVVGADSVLSADSVLLSVSFISELFVPVLGLSVSVSLPVAAIISVFVLPQAEQVYVFMPLSLSVAGFVIITSS